MKQRIYADTSVFGGYYDEEFADHTIPFLIDLKMKVYLTIFHCYPQEALFISHLKVKELVRSFKFEKTGFFETTIEAIELATEYHY
ncbi:MAG: hypothetical protein IPH42_19080 [Bacteroidetes bacterium]|nr:hypothetical protein [Bacteroidota bacterium]